jgi:Zn-dependent hydrolases, including glyoxylases
VNAWGDRVETFTGEATLAPGVTAVPMPGHTVGHTGLRVESNGQQMLIWADLIHVGAVQFARPEVTIGFDTDQDRARATWLQVMDAAATDRLLIAGSHIGFPGVGYVERQGEGYHFTPMPWQYR